MSEPHAHRGAVALVTMSAKAVVQPRLVRDLRAADWFPHCAVVAWVADVEAAREDRYR